MRLRDLEKMKKELGFYKNISEEIGGKKVVELNKELSVTITKLLERKALIEKLIKGDYAENESDKIQTSLENNGAYFKKLTERQKSEIAYQFEMADDSYAKTAQWQSLYMAFIATENISAYKPAEKFETLFEDLKRRKDKIDEEKRLIKEQEAEYTKDYPYITPKNAAEEFKKLQKENLELNEQRNSVEEDSENKKKEAELQKKEIADKYKKAAEDIEIKKNEVKKKYQDLEAALMLRKEKLEEEYRKKELAFNISPLTIEAKNVYKAVAEKFKDPNYIKLLSIKEYEAFREEYQKKVEAHKKAIVEVAKNATGAFKEYVEAPTQKEKADIDICKKAAGFLHVLRNPIGKVATEFLSRYDGFRAPNTKISNVGKYLNTTLRIKENNVSIEIKQKIAFAKACKAALKDFAFVYLKGVENPTNEQINEVVDMLESGEPTYALEKVRARRKEVETVIEERRKEISLKFTEKDKEDFKIYTKPAPEDVKPEDLKKAREFYDEHVKRQIDLAYLHDEGRISVEEAENRIRSDCHNEIEKMMKNAVLLKTKELSNEVHQKKYHVGERERGVRYDIWLKKEIEKIDAYEQYFGKAGIEQAEEAKEKFKSDLEKINQEIEENKKKKTDEITKLNKVKLVTNKNQMNAELKEVDNKLNEHLDANKNKIAELDMKTQENFKKIHITTVLRNPATYFDLEPLKKALDEGQKAPKIESKSVLEETRRAANILLKQQKLYADGHTNSKEFDDMMIKLSYIGNWRTKFDVTKDIPGAPKTLDEAYEQLKASCTKYIEAKDRQHRWFPSKLRYARYELARTLETLADFHKENQKDVIMDEKVVDSWNKYFESRGETPILTEENTVQANPLEQEVKQVDDPNLEDDGLDLGSK